MKAWSANTPVAAVALALTLGLAGCGLMSHPKPKPPSAPPPVSSASGPHVLTNLNSLAPENNGGNELIAPEAAQKAVASSRQQALAAPRQLASAGDVRHVGTAKNPGEERLMNAKAARFANVSSQILGQLFVAMQSLELQPPIDRLRLPSALEPVIVTGILDRNGKLKELILDQHSGNTQVDHMVVEACKQALYMNNPPRAALTADGNYKVKVQASISNYVSPKTGPWTFKTRVGIALL